MPKMKHPVVPGWVVEVSAAAEGSWRAAGWLGARARGPEPEPEPSPVGPVKPARKAAKRGK